MSKPIVDNKRREKRAAAVICLAIAIAIFTAYFRSLGSGFVDYDDNEYVFNNFIVRSGITLRGAIWAFTSLEMANWHPLTWLSHMLDCSIYGLNPLGHHLTNLLLHSANSILLFLLLRRMTGSLWKSAFVGAAFALHPTHVESVAWVAERKDVLSAFFGIIAIWAYVRYVERPSAARYILTALAFALGLMAKPMLVTLPVALLILDYWPLGRNVSIVHLIVEKSPLFALTFGSCIITFIAQKGSAVATIDALPIAIRLQNAVVAYAAYIGKIIWPAGLTVLYPFPVDGIPVWKSASSLALLLAITAVAIRLARNHRFVAAGWFWYLITLLPVIGVVQVGLQSMADRYLYIPSIGLFIIAAWGFASVRLREKPLSGLKFLAVAVILAFGVGSWAQVGFWKDSPALFGRAVEVNPKNPYALNNYGFALMEAGEIDEAVLHFQSAIKLRPKEARFRSYLGQAFDMQGKASEAMSEYRAALELNPNETNAANNLAWILAASADPGLRNGVEAVELAKRSLRHAANEQKAAVLDTLAVAYAESGRFEDALATEKQALEAALARGQTQIADQIRERIPLFEARRPYRDPN